MHDWPNLFKDLNFPLLFDGFHIRVVQVSWVDCEIVVYGDKTGPSLACKPVKDTLNVGVDRKTQIVVKPDFCLIRNQPRGPTPLSDKKNVLLGLIAANVPSINSFMSEYLQLERPVMLGAMRAIRERLGQDVFPLNEVLFVALNHLNFQSFLHF